MKTEFPKNMFSKRKEDQDGDIKDDSISHKNGLLVLPPPVVQVSREEIKKFLRGKRVGNYLLGKTVGSGSFARVKQGLHILTGEKVAVKIIDKKLAQEDPYVAKNMRREARLLQMVRHPNVIKLLEVVETEHRYYLITEVAQGGDLMDYICYRKRLGEREVRKFTRQIVSAVHYLHQAGIIHRDLKIENLLMDEDFNIKIIDFGLSNILHRHQSDKRSRMEHCQTQCGSPAYAAPEILGHKPYGLEADVWSIGVNMFAMLTGKLPFTAEPFHITTLYNKMKNNEINPLPDTISSACKEMVWRFLTFDPKKRITLDEAMEHEWMKKGSEEPFLPVRFPNYLKEQHLNQDIITHMVEKMSLKRVNVVNGLSQNRATPESTIYHLLKTRLDRFLQGQPKRRTLHGDELLPIDSLQAKALSTSKGSAVTRNQDLEELDTSPRIAISPDVTGACSPAEEHGMETVVDGIKAGESLADDNDGRLNNHGRTMKVDDTPVLVVPDGSTMFEPFENARQDENQNVLKVEEFRREEEVNKDSAVVAGDQKSEHKQDANASRKQDDIPNFSHLSEPNEEEALTSSKNLSSIGSFEKQNSHEVKIVSSFKNTSPRSNISHISVSSLRTPSQDRAVQMSITISSAKSLVDSQALIEEKGKEEKDRNSSEETNCSLPKRKKSSGRLLEKKYFPSKIPAIGGVSPARAKVISIPLTSEKDEDKDQITRTRRFTLPSSRVTLPESVRLPGPRQRDKTPLSLSFTTMVERIAAKANEESLDRASTPSNPSQTSRGNRPIGSTDEKTVTLKQSGYSMCYQLGNAKETESDNDSSLLSRESVRVTAKDLSATQQLTRPEVVLRPPSPRPPSSHRYTIPVVQGKDLYKIIIGSTVAKAPSTRVRTKAVPRKQSKIPVPISEFSEKEPVKQETGETLSAGRVFKLPLPLPKSKRTSLEHVKDLKTQEPPSLMSNMVLTYHTKSPAIRPLPLSPCDKDPKSPGLSKNNSANEICGRDELVRRRVWRRTCKDEQDEIKDRRRTIHVTDAAYVTPVTQEKRSSRSVNSEHSVSSSNANSPSFDETRRRVRVRTRPRSWIEPSANPPIITSSQISIIKFTHRRT